jgi:hypothetical protein
MAVTDGSEDAVAAQDVSLEETARRIRELNEQMLASARTAGARTLEAYELALQTLAAAVTGAGGATPFEWVAALAQAQAEFVRSVTVAYTAVLRVLLD